MDRSLSFEAGGDGGPPDDGRAVSVLGGFDFSGIEEMDPSLGQLPLPVCHGSVTMQLGYLLLLRPGFPLCCGFSHDNIILALNCSAGEGYKILYDRECPFEMRLQVVCVLALALSSSFIKS